MDHKKDYSSNSVTSAHTVYGIRQLGMMLVCCLVPLTAALLLKQMGFSGVASYLVLLLCPVMHLVLMKDMLTNKDKGKVKS